MYTRLGIGHGTSLARISISSERVKNIHTASDVSNIESRYDNYVKQCYSYRGTVHRYSYYQTVRTITEFSITLLYSLRTMSSALEIVPVRNNSTVFYGMSFPPSNRIAALVWELQGTQPSFQGPGITRVLVPSLFTSFVAWQPACARCNRFQS